MPDLEGLLGNPFSRSREARVEDATRLARGAGRTLARLLLAGERTRAERLVLALGHAQAIEAPDAPRQVLAADSVPTRLWHELPRSRGEYLRVVMAAGRCHRALADIAGASPQVRSLRERVWSAAFGSSLWHALELERVIRDHDVLILGETGTGKELVARALMAACPGGRDGGPAPSGVLNAAAVPETLIGSELFGHVRGAFTGASQDRAGRIRAAHGGCFFLDEIGDLPTTIQVQLLRVMEANLVNPLGSDQDAPADVRYITATHKPLDGMVEAGAFRRDLFGRIADRVIRLSPLRERPEDVAAIGLAFVDRELAGDARFDAVRQRIGEFLEGAAARRHAWPGNVRELQNVLRAMMLGMEPVLSPAPPAAARAVPSLPTSVARATASLRQVEDWYLGRVLAAHDGNYSEAARVLELDRSTVRRRALALSTAGGDRGPGAA